MKTLQILFFTLITSFTMSQTSIYDLSFDDINGNKVNLSDFKGKKIMFVNTASECGFTGQYTELQELHEKYGDKLVLIGFPCDQFGGQEPGSESEIQSFCKKNYGVTFLMASKIDVKGANQHPVYQWLTSKGQNGVDNSTVMWNFEKFIVDENGNLVDHFKSPVTPMSDKIISIID